MRTDVMSFASELHQWGVTLPDEAIEVGKLRQAIGELRAPADPLADLQAAIATGDVTTANLAEAVEDAALAISVSKYTADVVGQLEPALNARLHRIIAAHTEAILLGLRTAWDIAADRLAEVVGLVREDMTAEDVVAANSSALLAAWHDMARATATLDAISRLRIRLSNEYGYAGNEMPFVCDFIGAVFDDKHLQKAEAIYTNKVFGGNGVTYDNEASRWVSLVRNGYTLRLNTPWEASRVAACQPLDPDPEPVAA